MGIEEIITAIVVGLGGSSGIAAVVGKVVAKRFEQKMRQEEAERRAQEAERKAHEAERRKFELFEVQTLLATAKLCEANAIALQNGKCNGETHAALEYLEKVRHQQKDFLIEKGVDHLF